MKNPECFGNLWEAITGPSGENCRSCDIQDKCLADFATKRLPYTQAQLGDQGTLSALAESLEVDEHAVLKAMAYQEPPKKISRQTPVKLPKKEDIPLEVVETKKKTKKLKEKKKKTTRCWGEKTYASRWSKERKKNPTIAQLTPRSMDMCMKTKHTPRCKI